MYSTRRAQFSIDNALPSVRAIGTPNFAVAGADAQIASEGNREAGADRRPFDRRQASAPTRLDALQTGFQTPLVRKAIAGGRGTTQIA